MGEGKAYEPILFFLAFYDIGLRSLKFALWQTIHLIEGVNE